MKISRIARHSAYSDSGFSRQQILRKTCFSDKRVPKKRIQTGPRSNQRQDSATTTARPEAHRRHLLCVLPAGSDEAVGPSQEGKHTVVPKYNKQEAVLTPELTGGKRRGATMGDELELAADKHIRYIVTMEKKKDSFESLVMEHIRLNGAYWGLTTLDLLHKLHAVDATEVIEWIVSCYHPESGGFGGNVGHDPHVLYTLSAVQVLCLFDRLDVLDVEKVANYVAGLQNEDGSFSGDIWGEVDTRFSYIALCTLSLLQRLHKIDVQKAVDFIVSCKNLDGGFGAMPGGESHAGQIFCCVGALAIAGSLHHVDRDLLGWWLCERQCRDGGLNGRPEKLADVCYSWWVLSSLIMIDRVHWIDREKLTKFILNCQDKENGGISDRPDNAVDIYHTYFGVAGLSLMEYPGVKPMDPAYALPLDVVNRIFLRK